MKIPTDHFSRTHHCSATRTQFEHFSDTLIWTRSRSGFKLHQCFTFHWLFGLHVPPPLSADICWLLSWNSQTIQDPFQTWKKVFPPFKDSRSPDKMTPYLGCTDAEIESGLLLGVAWAGAWWGPLSSGTSGVGAALTAPCSWLLKCPLPAPVDPSLRLRGKGGGWAWDSGACWLLLRGLARAEDRELACGRSMGRESGILSEVTDCGRWWGLVILKHCQQVRTTF